MFGGTGVREEPNDGLDLGEKSVCTGADRRGCYQPHCCLLERETSRQALGLLLRNLFTRPFKGYLVCSGVELRSHSRDCMISANLTTIPLMSIS